MSSNHPDELGDNIRTRLRSPLADQIRSHLGHVLIAKWVVTDLVPADELPNFLEELLERFESLLRVLDDRGMPTRDRHHAGGLDGRSDLL